MESLMANQPDRIAADKTVIEVFRSDRDRLNDLARQLTGRGQGRYYQAETVRHLLDEYDRTSQLLLDVAEAAEPDWQVRSPALPPEERV
jgi:hypothetical protein